MATMLKKAGRDTYSVPLKTLKKRQEQAWKRQWRLVGDRPSCTTSCHRWSQQAVFGQMWSILRRPN
jgi:hypothetical protein